MNNPGLVEELNAIRVEYNRLRGEASVTDAEIADLIARMAALEALVADLDTDGPGAGIVPPGDGGDSEDESTADADETTDAEEDKLPPAGETNKIMISIFGAIFVGSGIALAFTFKKNERTE